MCSISIFKELHIYKDNTYEFIRIGQREHENLFLNV